MKYRNLGASQLEVSLLCLGTMMFGDQTDEKESATIVADARERGVNFIDTADVYTKGESERIVGRLIRAERHHWVLATKLGNAMSEEPNERRYSRKWMLREIDESLQRLQTDHIDLYQIHAWDPITRPDEVAAAFQQLRREGKVRWFGVSNLNPEQMDLYRAHWDVSSLQPPYSLLARDIEQRELPYCLRHNIGVLNYSSLHRGLLGGKYTADTTFADHRAKAPLFQGAGLKIILAAVEEAKAIAAEQGLTMAQLAVRWVLTNPAITSAIVGVKKPEHITGIVKAADGALPQDLWHRLAARFRQAQTEALAAK